MYFAYMQNSKHDDLGEDDLNKRFQWIWIFRIGCCCNFTKLLKTNTATNTRKDSHTLWPRLKVLSRMMGVSQTPHAKQPFCIPPRLQALDPAVTACPLGAGCKNRPRLFHAPPAKFAKDHPSLTFELRKCLCHMHIRGMLLINGVTTRRFYAKRGRRGEGEANPHIHHRFRSRWSLKFLQLPSSQLTGNISVQFPAPKNRWSFARLEPRERPDKAPRHSSPHEAHR